MEKEHRNKLFDFFNAVTGVVICLFSSSPLHFDITIVDVIRHKKSTLFAKNEFLYLHKKTNYFTSHPKTVLLHINRQEEHDMTHKDTENLFFKQSTTNSVYTMAVYKWKMESVQIFFFFMVTLTSSKFSD